MIKDSNSGGFNSYSDIFFFLINDNDGLKNSI